MKQPAISKQAANNQMGLQLNDFVIKLANVNGTGSASANGLLSKTIFRMGVPISAKNFFPSNIQGLPTWYEVRVSKDGYQARSGRVDVMVAMNAETYADDVAEVSAGGYLLYDSSWPMNKELLRDDVTFLGIPLAKHCAAEFDSARVRILMKNVMYVGALVALLDLDIAVVEGLLEEQFAAKPKLVPLNMRAVKMGYDYAMEHFNCPLPVRVARMDVTHNQIMMDGNTAAGLGCMYAGATVGAWYPITPSTSLMDAFDGFCQRFRQDPETGEKHYCVIQAEDELSAIGMVIGASWNGARAFTPTSGPGISLMSEFIGFAYFTELPAVLFDVQRVGPSTGMPTRTQQGDVMMCAYASHGDTKHVCLYPADPEECFYLSVKAFDLAEQLQTPVFVLSDLDIGMNEWQCPELQWDDAYQPNRGKVLDAEALDKIERFYRYMDIDGDGICARSLPGVHPKGAFFTRGSGHNKYGAYTEDPDQYQEVLDRLTRKFKTAASVVPEAVIHQQNGVTDAVIAYGSSDCAVREALDRLKEQGMHLNYLRIRAFPFGEEVEAFINAHQGVFVVEQNRDAQMVSLLTLETGVDKNKLVPLLHYGGFPLYAEFVVNQVSAHLNKRKNA